MSTTNTQTNGDAAAGTPSQISEGETTPDNSGGSVPQSVSGADTPSSTGGAFDTPAPTMSGSGVGSNVALLNDPVDVIIDKLLR